MDESFERRIFAPDLWEILTWERELVEGVIATRTNAPFTKKEQAAISVTLNEIKNYIIKTQQPSGEQAKIVQTQIEYLSEASTRLGRKDWTILAIGTLVNIFVSAVFAPDSARQIFRFAASVLHQVFGDSLYSPHRGTALSIVSTPRS